jgi:hypothetical protein
MPKNKPKKNFDFDFGTQCKLIKQFNAYWTIWTYFETLMNNSIPWDILQKTLLCIKKRFLLSKD